MEWFGSLLGTVSILGGIGTAVAAIIATLQYRQSRSKPLDAHVPAQGIARSGPLDIDPRFVEHEHGDLLAPVYRETDEILRGIGGEMTGGFRLDDCVRLYRVRRRDAWDDGIAVNALCEPLAAEVSELTPETVESMLAETRLDEEVKEYLRRRPLGPVVDPFWAKVSLRRIHWDNDHTRSSKLILDVCPMSYWIEREINRRIVLERSTDQALGDLFRAGVVRTLGPGNTTEGYDIGVPNTLYVEVAVITSDGRLLVMVKPDDTGGVYAKIGRGWTCGVERSLNWAHRSHARPARALSGARLRTTGRQADPRRAARTCRSRARLAGHCVMPLLRWHPTTRVPDAEAPDMRAATHASRRTLERVLRNPHDDAAWEDLREYYDDQADTWSEWAWQQPWYVAPVEEGLRRARPARLAVEVSCGTGQATPLLDAFVTDRLIATDVNVSMLENTADLPRTTYVAADVRQLPLRAGSVPLLVGLNAVPHLAEFARVLDGTGQLLWCTSFGAGTPLYVDPQRLVDLLGSGWDGDAGRAGHGEWVLLTRRV